MFGMHAIGSVVEGQGSDQAECAAAAYTDRRETAAVQRRLQRSDARAIIRDLADDRDILVGQRAGSRGGDSDRGRYCVQREGGVEEGDVADLVNRLEMLGVRAI